MKSGLQVACALGVGFLLGRKRKTRLTLALGAAAATGGLGRFGGALQQRLAQGFAASSGLSKLAGPGRRLAEAGTSAAVAEASRRVDALGQRLHERADALQQMSAETDRSEVEDVGQPAPETEAETEPASEAAREPEPRPRKKAAKQTAKQPAKKAAKRTKAARDKAATGSPVRQSAR